MSRSKPGSPWTGLLQIVIGSLLWGSAFQVGAAPVCIVQPAGRPPLVFAAREIEQALKATGETATIRPVPAARGFPIVLRIAPGAPESYRVRARKDRIEITGGDARGAMYGGLDVAEQIRLGGGRAAVRSKTERPFLSVRAYKFNIPLPGVGYAGAESLKYNQWFYDLRYWERFLAMMARNRYNALTFWSAHPYDRLLKLAKYPEATDLPPDELRRSQDFFHRLFALAKEHGIDTYLVTWNIHVSPAFAKAHRIPASGFDSPLVRDYQKECVRELLAQYPELTGLGTCPGEAMGRLNAVERADWIRQTYFQGIKESGRVVPFILRSWQADPKATAAMLTAARYPGPVYLDIKFNGEHVYSSPKPHLRDKLWLTQQPKGYRLLWHLRNDDLFTLRWGDPEFARRTILNCGGRESAGFVMGSEIEIPGEDRIHTAATAGHKTWQYEFEKQWFRFMLWGRLGYRPDEPESLWIDHYRACFGDRAGPDIYRAVQLASRILPQVTAFHWNYMNGDWYPEGCIGGWNTSYEAPHLNYRDKEMFHTVEEFIFNNTIDDSLENIPAFVLREMRGMPKARGVRTPYEVADEIGAWARESWRLAAKHKRVPRGQKEWECTRADLYALYALGQYYRTKISGAVCLGRYLLGDGESARFAAMTHLQNAARWWKRLAAVGDRHYSEHEVWLFGLFSWGKYLPTVERDVEIARRAVPLRRSGLRYDETARPELLPWVRYLNALSAQPPWKEAVARLRAADAKEVVPSMKLMQDEGNPGMKVLLVPKGAGRGFDLATGKPIDRGRAAFTVTIPKTGDYIIFARCRWPDGAANSFYVSFDDGLPQTLGNENEFQTWHWVASPAFPLAAGQHRLIVRNREDGARMEQIVIAAAEKTSMASSDRPGEPSGDVLTPAEREQFFRRYFDRMNAPKPLTRFRTKKEWLAYKGALREKILRSLGLWPLPERLPPAPQITGRIEHADYTVERVYYQVFPRVYAGGYLYVPKAARNTGVGRFPAILNPHGHWPQGAADPVVQTRCIALAKRGYVAFCPDSTHAADFPTGLCPIGQMTWNNVRALDYLESLPCVDPARIGCTGASGGGQQTMYLAALDERVKVPVPVVLISYFRRILFPTEEAHCFCNHAPGIAGATDETEMAAMFAPRPTRFLCATGDWTRDFPREEFPEIKHIFKLVGGDVDCVQFDKPHNYDRDSRESMYAWMNRYLKGDSDSNAVKEPPVTTENPDALTALSKPLSGAAGMEGAPAFYRKTYMFRAPHPQTRAQWQAYTKELRARLRDLLGENVPGVPLNPRSRGTVTIQGMEAEKWLLDTEPAVTVPAWLFRTVSRPPIQRAPAVVIVHPGGKQALLRERAALVRALLARGVIVLAADPRMRGELRRNWQWNAMIWGRPEDGMAAHDLCRAGAWLRARPDVNPQQVYVLGLGEAGMCALFAGGLDPKWAGVAVDSVGPLYTDGRSTNIVANILRYGDLPQFAALAAPRPLWLNGAGKSFDFTAGAYRGLTDSASLRCSNLDSGTFDNEISSWLESSVRNEKAAR